MSRKNGRERGDSVNFASVARIHTQCELCISDKDSHSLFNRGGHEGSRRVWIQVLLPLKTIHNSTFEEDVVTTINLERRVRGGRERERGKEEECVCMRERERGRDIYI